MASKRTPLERYAQALREIRVMFDDPDEAGWYSSRPGSAVVFIYISRLADEGRAEQLAFVLTHEIVHHVHRDWDEDQVNAEAARLLKSPRWREEIYRALTSFLAAAYLDPHGVLKLE